MISQAGRFHKIYQPKTQSVGYARLAISLPIRCGMPTIKALPMQNARLMSVMPVSVQPFGKPCSWSSSSGTNLRNRPSGVRTICLLREADPPPHL